MEDKLKKANDENLKLSKEVLELKNFISKFKKGKETLNNLLDSRKFYRDTHGIGYINGLPSSSSSHINFVKNSCDSTPSSSKPLETQAFKVKMSYMSYENGKPYKTQCHLT